MTTSDDLSIGGHIGANTKDLLDSSGSEPEAGDNFIDNERDSGLLSDLPHCPDKRDWLQAWVAGLHRLNQDRCDLVRVLAYVLQRLIRAVLEDNNVAGIGDR